MDNDMLDCVLCTKSFASLKTFADHARLGHMETYASGRIKTCKAEQTHLNYYDLVSNVKLEIVENDVENEMKQHNIISMGISSMSDLVLKDVNNTLKLEDSSLHQICLIKKEEEDTQVEIDILEESEMVFDFDKQNSISGSAQKAPNLFVEADPSQKDIEKFLNGEDPLEQEWSRNAEDVPTDTYTQECEVEFCELSNQDRRQSADFVPEVKRSGKKKNIYDTFIALANEKQELVRLRIQIAENQLIHQQKLQEIQLDIAKENLKHVKEKNALEIEHLKEKYNIELELLKNPVKRELDPSAQGSVQITH